MGADLSIYANLLRPPKSVADYDNEHAQQQSNALALQTNGLQFQKAKADMAEDAAFNAAVRGGGDSNALMQASPKRALAHQKAMLDNDKTRGDIKLSGARAGEAEASMTAKSLDAYRSVLSTVQKPEQMAQWFDALYANPATAKVAQSFGTAEQMKARIPTDPAAFAQFVQKNAMGMEKWVADQTSRANNTMTNETSRLNNAATNATSQANNSATNATSRANNAATVGQSERNSVRVDSRADERLAFDKTKPGAGAAKPMPASAAKLQNEELSALGTFAGLESDLAGLRKQLTDGSLKLGPFDNLVGSARNYAGMSDENSRNLASFKAKMENMRNAVLLLNKGVQTEGDAQRAMSEIFANINDPKVVGQRLEEIEVLNRRAADLRKNNVNTLRQNFGHDEMDFSKYETQPAAVDLKKAPAGKLSATEQAELDQLRARFKK